MAKRVQHIRSKKPITSPANVRVAFQGGGALGAYGAGVAQALDKDPLIHVTETGGLSAGAVNSAILATSGSDGLHNFWQKIGSAGKLAKVLDPLNLMETFNNSYLMRSFRRNGAYYDSGVSPLNHLENLLRDSIGSDQNLQTSPVEIFVSTVTKKDLSGGLSVDNVDEHIHTRDTITIQKVAASGALRSLGPIRVDGDYHWDGVYGGKNPNLHVYDSKDPTPLIVVTVDQPGVRTSSHDEDIVYGTIHDDIENVRSSMVAPVYQVSLRQPEHWRDDMRLNPHPKLIEFLQAQGWEDGTKVLDQIKVDKFGPNWQERIAPEIAAA